MPWFQVMLTQPSRYRSRRAGIGYNFLIRHTLYGGVPLEVSEIRRLLRILGNSLVQLYGRIEAGWPLTVLDQRDHQMIYEGHDRLGLSCGRPEFRLQRISERTDQGELQTRNPMVVPDYANPDVWSSLGDVASIDEKGIFTSLADLTE